MIDTHSHLTSNSFKNDLDQVITNTKNEKILAIISQGTSLESAKEVLELSKKYKGYVYPTIGIHPEDIASIFMGDETKRNNEYIDRYINELKTLLKENIGESGFKAVGEIGLDYFMFHIDLGISKLPKDKILELIEYQKYFLEKELELSIEFNLPVVIHAREFPEVNEIFDKYKCINDVLDLISKVEKRSDKKLKAVFHCWTYQDKELINKILDMGYFVSFTNIICYPKNTELLNLAKYVLDTYPKQIMLETDSPYLPPANRRGERCEPTDVKYVYEKFPDSETLIDENVKSFFSL